MLNLKALLTNILNTLTLRSGVTMTGEVRTNTEGTIIASGQTGTESGLTISEFVDQIRYSSGAMGSVKINSSTAGGVTFSGWYNYCYIPHRNGGLNGQARTTGGTDNHSYGNIIIGHMTTGGQFYNIRVASNTIAKVTKLDTTFYENTSTYGGLTSVSTTYYSLETSTGRTSYRKIGRIVTITMGVTPKSPQKWASSAFASGAPAPYGGLEVYGCLCCDTDHSTVSIAIQSDGTIKAGGGVANKLYYGTIHYVSAS